MTGSDTPVTISLPRNARQLKAQGISVPVVTVRVLKVPLSTGAVWTMLITHVCAAALPYAEMKPLDFKCWVWKLTTTTKEKFEVEN